MCGRYVITEEMFAEYERIVRDFDPLLYRFLPRDIYPSALAPVIRAEGDHLAGRNMIFGFSGFEKGKMLINARSETVLEKITFKDAVRKRRCVMPAASFYEWDHQKQKAVFRRSKGELIWLAGFYRPEEDGDHFVILTRAANASMAPIHDRMPLILDQKDIEPWIREDALLNAYLSSEGKELAYQIDSEQLSLF